MNFLKPLHAILSHPATTFIVRLLLGGIFIAAAVPKILDTTAFANAVYNYHLIPDIFINIIAITLPWLEIIIGSLIITGIWMPGAVILYNLLMIGFIIALSFNMARGLNISCGCFSTNTEDIINMGTIFRDIAILCGSLYLFIVLFFNSSTAPGE